MKIGDFNCAGRMPVHPPDIDGACAIETNHDAQAIAQTRQDFAELYHIPNLHHKYIILEICLKVNSQNFIVK